MWVNLLRRCCLTVFMCRSRAVLRQRKPPWVCVSCERLGTTRGAHTVADFWLWVHARRETLWVLHRAERQTTVAVILFSLHFANELFKKKSLLKKKRLFYLILQQHFVFACRYFLRATIGRRLSDITKELDIVVHTLSTYPELNSSIKMEVGIEDCLHIEFEYNKSKYDTHVF